MIGEDSIVSVAPVSPTSTGQVPWLSHRAAASRRSSGGSISETNAPLFDAEQRVRGDEGAALRPLAMGDLPQFDRGDILDPHTQPVRVGRDRGGVDRRAPLEGEAGADHQPGDGPGGADRLDVAARREGERHVTPSEQVGDRGGGRDDVAFDGLLPREIPHALDFQRRDRREYGFGRQRRRFAGKRADFAVEQVQEPNTGFHERVRVEPRSRHSVCIGAGIAAADRRRSLAGTRRRTSSAGGSSPRSDRYG